MKKVRVGILGATGMVGQKFIELLTDHPWFEITALAASDRSSGKTYREGAQWRMASPLPRKIAEMPLSPCLPNLPCRIVFSGLDAAVAGEIEEAFAHAGYCVISNSRNHRMDPDVPLMIPEVNSSHLELLKLQRFSKGMLVTNPNCAALGLCLALKPLIDLWGVEAAHIVTLQALSGAGYPGVASLDTLDNVIPFIGGEEEKLETEPLKILGTLSQKGVIPYPIRLSAHCNRVQVTDGHLGCVSVRLRQRAESEEIITAWKNFTGEPQALNLPTAPSKPIYYSAHEAHPQPKLHRLTDKGMAVTIGRLRPCPLFDWKFTILSHNTIRGAAGCALLNAELLLKKGYL